jgi:AmmeMemoRadiSam system protein B
MLRNVSDRRAAVAGFFYPSDREALHSLVARFLDQVDASPAPATAAIAPHAGLVYSGQCAAHVWARIALPSTVVILAPNHTGRLDNPGGAGAWDRGAFHTPLGSVTVAEEFMSRLEAACDRVRHDASAHNREHAIEVQLPFLQLLSPETVLAPLVIAWDRWEPSRELGAALAEVVRQWPDDVLLVASSDMTHYESAASAERKDRMALEAVAQLDGEALLDTCHREGVTMCGRGPAAVVLEAARQLGATKAEVVDYRHSGMVTGDDSEVVAYAGVVIR